MIVLNSLYTGRVHAVREEKAEIIILHYMCETEVGNTDDFGNARRRLKRFESILVRRSERDFAGLRERPGETRSAEPLC